MVTPRILHDKTSLAVRAKFCLGLTSGQLADLLDSSLRTMERLVVGRAPVYDKWLEKLAIAVHPRDPQLAWELADACGRTLEALGLGLPADRGAAPVAAMPAATRALLVESVVAAAAEALDASPRVVRPALLAALERARAAGLSIDDLLAVLRPPAAPAPETAKKAPRPKG